MATRGNRDAHDPSWAEVILGAALSVALGVVLGAVLLAIKPLVAVKEMPKEPVAGVIYYFEGARDPAKAKQAAAKRKVFTDGGSISVTEEEINSFLAAPPTAAPAAGAKPKPGEKAKAPDKPKAGAAAAPAGEVLTVADPSFRIRDGVVQIAVPVTVNLLGLEERLTVLARGTFAKRGDVFAFDPTELYFGSCPLQRIPLAADYVVKKFLTPGKAAEDVTAVWSKLSAVAVEGNTLKLTMP